MSKKLFLVPSFFALILLVSGCTDADAAETLAIEHRGAYEGVLVSGDFSDSESNEYEEVLVSGEEKANYLIDTLNGTELVEASDKELQEKAGQLEAPGSYRMILYNMPSANSTDEHMYLIVFYQDGTIEVNQEGITYFVKNPPEDLLAQLKSDWNITF